MSLNIPSLDLAISLTATQQEILPNNPARSYALMVNDSDSVAYISMGKPAEANRGIRLNASGGSYEINSTNLYKGRIYAVSTGAGKTLLVVEW